MSSIYQKQKEAQIQNVIRRWERQYSIGMVRILVTDRLTANRSPYQRPILRAWLDEHLPEHDTPKQPAVAPDGLTQLLFDADMHLSLYTDNQITWDALVAWHAEWTKAHTALLNSHTTTTRTSVELQVEEETVYVFACFADMEDDVPSLYTTYRYEAEEFVKIYPVTSDYIGYTVPLRVWVDFVSKYPRINPEEYTD